MRKRIDRVLAALGLARHGEMEDRYSEEARFHIDMYATRAIAEGRSPAEARREALAAFGGTEAYRDAARDAWGARHVDELRKDIRLALRALRRNWAFTIAASLILAIGLGATTAIFSVVDNVLLRPLPYPGPDRLVVVRESIRELAEQYPTLSANASHYLEWKRSCRQCEDIAAMRPVTLVMFGKDEPLEVTGIRASANLLPMLGVQPIAGRLFTEAEDDGAERVALLGHAFWQTRFGADRGIIGQTLSFGGIPTTIIGVLPPDLVFPEGFEMGSTRPYPDNPDLFVPLSLNQRERTTPGEFSYAVIARMKEGATIPQLASELQSLQRTVGQRGNSGATFSTVVATLQDQMVGQSRRPLVILFAAGAGVLLIVCTNLANLLIARNLERRREAAVRVALGAGRGRLVRQSLTESLVLALLGGALGIALAAVGVSALVNLAPSGIPRIDEVRLDARVLAAGLAATLLAGAAFGILPALRFGSADGSDMLRGSERATSGKQHARSRNILVATQVATSTVLLVTTGLLLTSLIRVLGVDRGFSAEQVLAMDLMLPRAYYDSASKRQAFFEQILTRAQALPGVTAAAASTAIPLEGDVQVDLLSYENDQRPAAQRPTANIIKVTPSYVPTLGLRLLRGRMFDESDRNRPVAVLSERAARSLWPDGNAVGQLVVPGSNDRMTEVIGIVGDVRTSRLEQEGSAVAYLPYWEGTPARATILVRSVRDASSLAPPLRALVRAIGPNVPIARVRTIGNVIDAVTAQRRFQLMLIGSFGLVALLTASVGVYAMIAYSLSRRTREIAIRMAVGARAADVHRLALREGMLPVVAGLAIGAVASVGAGRAIASMLYGATPGDPLTTVVVAAVILFLAALACSVPVRRAVRAGTATALRSD